MRNRTEVWEKSNEKCIKCYNEDRNDRMSKKKKNAIQIYQLVNVSNDKMRRPENNKGEKCSKKTLNRKTKKRQDANNMKQIWEKKYLH